jgi:hypothetical protein
LKSFKFPSKFIHFSYPKIQNPSAHIMVVVHLLYLLKFVAIVGPLSLLAQPAQAAFFLHWSEPSRDSRYRHRPAGLHARSSSSVALHARPWATAPYSPATGTGAPSPPFPRETDGIKIAPPSAIEGPHQLHCPPPQLPSRPYKRNSSILAQLSSSQSPKCILYCTPGPPHHLRCATSHRRQ